MQIGIFENPTTPFYRQMYELSKELNFTLVSVEGTEDAAIERIEGLIATDTFKSAAGISSILKKFKSILLLDPANAASILTSELAIICEEANVELMVAGPPYHSELFRFITANSFSPYYVRAVKETSRIDSFSFDTLYHLLYWNAFFSEGDIRKFKINSMPAVSPDGLLVYGRSESAINIPVDIWFTNLGFEERDYLRIFSQTEVVELDCRSNTFRVKNSEGVSVESYSPATPPSKEPYIRSFISRLKNEESRALNISHSKFLKLVDFYASMVQQVNL